MAGKEKAAAQRQRIPHGKGQPSVPGHKADARHAQRRGQHIEAVRPRPVHRPVEKRHDDAVYRSKKSIFPRRSIHQAVILHRVGGKEEHPHQAAPPPVGGVNPLPPPPEHQRQQNCRKGEPEGQQEHQVHVVQGILHDKKGGPPDEGGRHDQRPSRFFQQGFAHAMLNSGSFSSHL